MLVSLEQFQTFIDLCTTGAGVKITGTITATIDETTLATNALQTTGNSLISAMSAKLPATLGVKAATASFSTAMCTEDAAKFVACNTGAVVVSSSALPSGAATSAAQTTAQTSLTSIDGKITACNTGAVVVSTCALMTGLAASALLADGATIPTTTKVGAVVMLSNGSTADIARGGLTSNSATFAGIQNTLPRLVYNASPTARTEGQHGQWQGDTLGNGNVNLGTLLAGEDQNANLIVIESRYSTTRITTATTTVVKSGAGYIYGIAYGKRVATGIITVYDNTSAAGTIIYVGTVGAAILQDPGGNTFFNRVCSTGITVVTSQAEDITILWR